MVKIKHHLLFLNIFLFIVLGLFLITNHYQVMAANDLNDEYSINNEINKLCSEKNLLAIKISYLQKYDLETKIYQKKLNILNQKIQNLSQRLSNIKVLNFTNEKIWDYSYERNQVVIKSFEHPEIQEFREDHRKLIEKINNLQQKYINLKYKLDE
ncbi:SVM family protein [Candidatus Phytoplasma asteris]|uniref:SVM family protein n=2 Tax=16SrI (Aster yellows group) TaxID=3042590 RepID=A0ABZ3CFH5_9MOLU|nr:MAG: putative secreted protein, SAP42-like [Rapeseed phyllody phytoplasma]